IALLLGLAVARTIHPRQIGPVAGARADQHVAETRNGVRNVVMHPRTRRMINAVPAAPRRPPLELRQLRHEPGAVDEIAPDRVQRRKKRGVEIALGFAAQIVGDAVLAKLLARPLAGEAIALHTMHTVHLAGVGKLLGRLLGRERWVLLAD